MSLWNKAYSILINFLMAILCILISNWDYPKEWEERDKNGRCERDLMVKLSRKLMAEGNESKFVIFPFYQWECINTETEQLRSELKYWQHMYTGD